MAEPDRTGTPRRSPPTRRCGTPGPRSTSTGEFYDLEGFKAGGVRLRPYEIELVGDVTGRSLLHLQCHFGIDTLSWARLGARVTGADFSPAAVELARSLADELGFPEARFVESNLYDLPDVLDGTFDVVYTSRGVLGWLPDIRGWARVVAHFLAPGGRFFITEVHPVVEGLRERGRGRRRAAPRPIPYWEHDEPLTFAVQGSYADRDADVGEQTEHWLGPRPRRDRHRADRRRAADRDARRAPVPRLEGRLPGRGRRTGPGGCLPDAGGELPLMFSLVATKPG